jgi:RNA polymerase primary sigma factor
MNRIEVTDEQISAAQAGDGDAMWQIVQAFDPMFSGMIRSIATHASAEDAEDLLQEARAVLIQHVRDYRTGASSASLTSFVYQAARRRIQEEHVKSTTHLSVDPTAVLRVRRALWQADGDVEGAWLIVSTCPNEKSRMERERFMAVVEALADVERLDAPATGSDGSMGEPALTLSDVIADPTAEISDPAERRDLAHWLMTQIPQRQAFALRAFYGVGMTRQEDPQTCADMGINGAALRRLRSRGVASARTVADVHSVAA